jgi:PAS domain S-box-containing protein
MALVRSRRAACAQEYGGLRIQAPGRGVEPNHMGRLRLASRTAFPRPLPALALAAYVLVYLSWQALHWLPGKQELGQLFLIPADAIALWAVWDASRRSAGHPRVHAFWRLFALAIAAELAADVALSYNDIHYAAAPFPSLADAFFLSFFALLFAALLRVPVARATRSLRVRLALDGATIVLGGGALVWYFVLGPNAVAGHGSPLATAVSLAYPIGDLVLLAGLAAVLLRRSIPVLHPSLLWIAAGVVLSIVADVVYGYGVLHGAYTGGDPIDTLYLLEFVCFTLAALSQRPVGADDRGAHAEQYARPAARASWLPYLALAGGFGLVLAVESHDAFFPGFSLMLILAALAALVATRQLLVQRALVRLQAALAESERRFRAIFDNAGVGITYTDLDGPAIIDANATFSAMVGRTPEQLRGQDYSSFAGPEFQGADRALAEAIKRGEIDQLQQELRYAGADGAMRWAMLTVSTVRDREGVPREVVGIFEDITRRREVERIKDELVSLVGHELRTPLTSIRGTLGLLDGGLLGKLPAEAREMIGVAIVNTDRLTRLVNDTLDAERARAGRLELERAPVAADELAAQAIQAVQATADAAGVELRCDAAELTVDADADRIVQTLVNLLGNAVKFSPAGGLVTLSAHREERDAHFCVHDEGRGIPADQLERIFERFNQVDASDTTEKGGTGLGLAISRGIVEGHGGRIWAASEPGRGATLHFTLPLAHAAAPVTEEAIA